MHNAVRDFVTLFQSELLPTGLSAPSTTDLERAFIASAGERLGAYADGLKDIPSTATGLGARLMLEKLGETLDAMAKGDVDAYADGLADLLYVVLWNAVTHGVPIDEVFAEVHRANMAKAPVCTKCNGSGREQIKLSPAASFFAAYAEEADVACDACAGKGRVITRDAAGKVVKPPGWTPPDIAGVLRRVEAERLYRLDKRGEGNDPVTVTPEAAAAMDDAHLRILASMPGLVDAERARMSAKMKRYQEAYGGGEDPHKETAANLYAATPETVAEAVFGEWWKLPADPVAELVDREDGVGIDLAPIVAFYTGIQHVHFLASHEAGPEHPDCTSLLYPGGYVVHIGDPVTQIVKLRNPWGRRASRCPRRPNEPAQAPVPRRGIYVASRVHHAPMWRKLRDEGAPIVSTWIDVENPVYRDHWRMILAQVPTCDALVLHLTPEDVPLKGAFVEVGIALAHGLRVFVSTPPGTNEATLAGSWVWSPGVTVCAGLDDAMRQATAYCAAPR